MVPVSQPGIARALNLREELFPARVSKDRERERERQEGSSHTQ